MVILRVYWFIVYAGLLGLFASIVFIGFVLKYYSVNILSSYYVSCVSIHGIFSMLLVLISVYWWLFSWRHGKRSSVSLESLALLLLVLFSTVLGSRASTGWTLYPPLNSDLGAALLFTVVLYFFLILIDAFLSSVVTYLTINVRSSARSVAVVGFIFTTLYALLLIPAVFRLIDIVFSSTIMVYPNGSALTYIELFWVFGHPVVYFFILPVIIFFFKTSVQVNTVGGKGGLVYITLNILLSVWLFSSFNVWGHHLYTNIFSSTFLILFSLASLFIAMPMGLCFWYFLRFSLRQLYDSVVLLVGEIGKPPKIIAFVAAAGFVIGGATGLFLLVPGNDTVVHGTRFVVGHFHAFLVIFVLAGFLVLFFLKIDQAALQGKGGCVYSKFGAARSSILVSVLFIFALLLFTGTSLETRRAFNLTGHSGQFILFTGTSRTLDLTLFFILLFGFFFNHKAPILAGYFFSKRNKKKLRILLLAYRFFRKIDRILDRASIPKGWMRRSFLVCFFVIIPVAVYTGCNLGSGFASFPEQYFFGSSLIRDLFDSHVFPSDPSFGSKFYYTEVQRVDPGFDRMREVLAKYQTAISEGVKTKTLPFIFIFLLKAQLHPELTLYYCQLFKVSFNLLYLVEYPNLVSSLNKILTDGAVDSKQAARWILGVRDLFDIPTDADGRLANRLYKEWRALTQRFLHNPATSLNDPGRIHEWRSLCEVAKNFLSLNSQHTMWNDFNLYAPEVARKNIGGGLLFNIHSGVHGVLYGTVDNEALCSMVVEEAALIPRTGPLLRLVG